MVLTRKVIDTKTGKVLEGHAHGHIHTEPITVKTRRDNTHLVEAVDEEYDVKVQEELGDGHTTKWTLYAILHGSKSYIDRSGEYINCDVHTSLRSHEKWFVKRYKECMKLTRSEITPPGSSMDLD